jgi:hypothetical protein
VTILSRLVLSYSTFLCPLEIEYDVERDGNMATNWVSKDYEGDIASYVKILYRHKPERMSFRT